jgi:hypothetical protein
MHEANAVRAAIRNAQLEREAAVAAGRAAGDHEAESSFRHLELEIMDPTRATPEAVHFHAGSVLEELGLREVSFDVFVRAVRCSLCGHLTHAEPADPVCRFCGAPVPRADGPAIEAHWTRAIVAPPGGPDHDGAQLAELHRHRVARVIR